jgi:hypothetical protein
VGVQKIVSYGGIHNFLAFTSDTVKSGMMRWAVQVAFTREMQSAENIVVITPEGKRPVWES